MLMYMFEYTNEFNSLNEAKKTLEKLKEEKMQKIKDFGFTKEINRKIFEELEKIKKVIKLISERQMKIIDIICENY